MVSLSRVLALCALAFSAALAAEDASDYPVPLTEGLPYLHVLHEGTSVKIQRVQDPDFELKGYYAKTARKCPPFCIHPMKVRDDIETIGEIELFEFLQTDLRDDTGLLIDARTPAWFKKATIPGSVNYPFTLLTKSPDDPEWKELLTTFGAVPRTSPGVIEQQLEEWGLVKNPLKTDKWDFTGAKKLVLFCNGPACDQSPRAIKGLLEVGYPSEKLLYYRGGMQMWELWGLTSVVPESTQ